MKVNGEAILKKFAKKHADTRRPLERWLAEMRGMRQITPADLRARWADADFLSGNRVVFNIKGNSYRLLITVQYAIDEVTILDIGTHQEYDTWNLR